jgi:hypothetical protein
LLLLQQLAATNFDIVTFDFLEGAKAHSIKDQMQKLYERIDG